MKTSSALSIRRPQTDRHAHQSSRVQPTALRTPVKTYRSVWLVWLAPDAAPNVCESAPRVSFLSKCNFWGLVSCTYGHMLLSISCTYSHMLLSVSGSYGYMLLSVSCTYGYMLLSVSCTYGCMLLRLL